MTTDQLDLTAMMRVYAEEAVTLAREEFDVAMNFSEMSLSDADQILAAIHNALPKDDEGDFQQKNPLNQWVEELAVIWGAYLGEVLLRYWHGEWTPDVPADHAETTAVRIGDILVYPISKAYHRLVSKDDSGLVVFYEELRWELSRNTGWGPKIIPAMAG